MLINLEKKKLISFNGYMIYDETYNASIHQRLGIC